MCGSFAGHMCRLGDVYRLAKLSIQRVCGCDELSLRGSTVLTCAVGQKHVQRCFSPPAWRPKEPKHAGKRSLWIARRRRDPLSQALLQPPGNGYLSVLGDAKHQSWILRWPGQTCERAYQGAVEWFGCVCKSVSLAGVVGAGQGSGVQDILTRSRDHVGCVGRGRAGVRGTRFGSCAPPSQKLLAASLSCIGASSASFDSARVLRPRDRVRLSPIRLPLGFEASCVDPA